MTNECQHFWNMIAAKLRNYNDTIRCFIQNKIMSVFLNANRVFYERYHHTHLQPINPPETHFPSGPSKILVYAQSIYPPPHTSLSSLCSQNPSPSCSGNTSPSPFSQYNNSVLPHSFPTESISPARGGVRSTRSLGPTMTARGQNIGISTGMLPQTLIMSRLDHLSRLGAGI